MKSNVFLLSDKGSTWQNWKWLWARADLQHVCTLGSLSTSGDTRSQSLPIESFSRKCHQPSSGCREELRRSIKSEGDSLNDLASRENRFKKKPPREQKSPLQSNIIIGSWQHSWKACWCLEFACLLQLNQNDDKSTQSSISSFDPFRFNLSWLVWTHAVAGDCGAGKMGPLSHPRGWAPAVFSRGTDTFQAQAVVRSSGVLLMIWEEPCSCEEIF